MTDSPISDSVPVNATSAADWTALARDIKDWGREFGFGAVGITGVDLSAEEPHVRAWLQRGFHGSMDYMQRHGDKRTRPHELVPGTVRVICVRLDYLPEQQHAAIEQLERPAHAYVSRYALGRDYHKVLRARLRRLAARVQKAAQAQGGRVFVDSAPVLEKALARNAGLGWIGKHTNLIDKQTGSWFFLGEIFIDIPLPEDRPSINHCGTCSACLDVCPTRAIVAPYQVDARLCISYLTIENKGAIPTELRPLMGNRVYGCDDCQLFCPWNKFAQLTDETDFTPRHDLDSASLVELMSWTAEEFDERTRGSAIRRTGFTGWQRNVAVALGNAPTSAGVVNALRTARATADTMVREHIDWALSRHQGILETL
ncbi:MAG: tRNA epoxyqueuosine(34) reductase QueG [Gammaproteobacteria bacterium]